MPTTIPAAAAASAGLRRGRRPRRPDRARVERLRLERAERPRRGAGRPRRGAAAEIDCRTEGTWMLPDAPSTPDPSIPVPGRVPDGFEPAAALRCTSLAPGVEGTAPVDDPAAGRGRRAGRALRGRPRAAHHGARRTRRPGARRPGVHGRHGARSAPLARGRRRAADSRALPARRVRQDEAGRARGARCPSRSRR